MRGSGGGNSSNVGSSSSSSSSSSSNKMSVVIFYLHTCLFTYLHTYILNYLLSYLITPWCRVLLEKLTGFQLVKKFPAHYLTRRLITAFTSARHLSQS